MSDDPILDLLTALDVPDELHNDCYPVVGEVIAVWLERAGFTICGAVARARLVTNRTTEAT